MSTYLQKPPSSTVARSARPTKRQLDSDKQREADAALTERIERRQRRDQLATKIATAYPLKRRTK